MSNNSVDVSLIIPIHNVEKHLLKCLDSVIAQTYTNYEVVLVNDGSTDASGEICMQYAERDSRFHVVHKPQGGVSNAKNVGIQCSQGKYIIFLDGDDAIEPEYLEVLMKPSELYELVICGIKKVSEDETVIYKSSFRERRIESINSTDVIEMLKEGSFNYNYAKRFNAKIIKDKKLTFFEKNNLGEDTLFAAEYLNYCTNVMISSKTLYCYYQHNGTLSGFSSSYVEQLQLANQMIERCLKTNFADVIDCIVWKKRLFSVYYYAIICILGKNYSFTMQYKMLKDIFDREDFQEFVLTPEVYMPNDSPRFCRMLQKRSPVGLLILCRLAKVKSRLKKQNNT